MYTASFFPRVTNEKTSFWFVLHENLKNTNIARLDWLSAVQLLSWQNLAHCQSSIGGHGTGPFSYKGSCSASLWSRYLGLARFGFAIHTWIAAKRTGESNYKVYDVVGWRGYSGQPVMRITQGHSGPLLVW